MEMEMEIFKDISGYEGVYQVSNMGRVKSLDRIVNGRWGECRFKERMLKPGISRGYKTVTLCKGNRKTMKIHQLVAMAFLNHTPNGHKVIVDHIDEDKFNNRLDNLQLVSNRENMSKYHRSKKTSSQYTGVSWDKVRNKWRSTIMIDGKNKHLGLFDTEIEAHEAYQEKLKQINDNN